MFIRICMYIYVHKCMPISLNARPAAERRGIFFGSKNLNRKVQARVRS